ncbi:MAG: helix-turn-helix domain-containing protein [Colwellia sp.]
MNSATTGISDYRLAKKLSISCNTVSAWRNRGTIPNDDVLEKLAGMAEMPVEKVYFAAYADKIHNPLVAQLLREQSHLAA